MTHLKMTLDQDTKQSGLNLWYSSFRWTVKEVIFERVFPSVISVASTASGARQAVRKTEAERKHKWMSALQLFV